MAHAAGPAQGFHPDAIAAASVDHTHGGSDQPCHEHDASQPNGGICAGSGGCSLCVPLANEVAGAPFAEAISPPAPTAVQAGVLTFPHFRPPEFSAHV